MPWKNPEIFRLLYGFKTGLVEDDVVKVVSKNSEFFTKKKSGLDIDLLDRGISIPSNNLSQYGEKNRPGVVGSIRGS